jgi:hypothetical protein
MTDPAITTEILPTGGIVALTLSSADQVGPWILTRSIVGSSLPAVTVYNGPPLSPPQAPAFPMDWIDAGDGDVLPLSPTKSYTWTFTTQAGTVTTAAVTPACMITVLPDDIADLILKMLQAGIESLRIPAGFANKPKIMHAMPLTGQPSLPIISFNEDMLQQSFVGIGDSVNPDTVANSYSVSAVVSRRYSITIMATTVQERKFYRDSIISIFRTMCGPALNRLGTNITHKFQAADSQVTSRDQSPGFYYSTIMLDLDGMFNVEVTTDYGIDRIIDIGVTYNFAAPGYPNFTIGLISGQPVLVNGSTVSTSSPITGGLFWNNGGLLCLSPMDSATVVDNIVLGPDEFTPVYIDGSTVNINNISTTLPVIPGVIWNNGDLLCYS